MERDDERNGEGSRAGRVSAPQSASQLGQGLSALTDGTWEKGPDLGDMGARHAGYAAMVAAMAAVGERWSVGEQGAWMLGYAAGEAAGAVIGRRWAFGPGYRTGYRDALVQEAGVRWHEAERMADVAYADRYEQGQAEQSGSEASETETEDR